MSDKAYDSSWDDADGDREAFERKSRQWEKRDWVAWPKAKLQFPFRARRMEDDQDSFAPEAGRPKAAFPAGCEVEVLGIADEDADVEFEGLIMAVRDSRRKGFIPLQDLEVRPKQSKLLAGAGISSLVRQSLGQSFPCGEAYAKPKPTFCDYGKLAHTAGG